MTIEALETLHQYVTDKVDLFIVKKGADACFALYLRSFISIISHRSPDARRLEQLLANTEVVRIYKQTGAQAHRQIVWLGDFNE